MLATSIALPRVPAADAAQARVSAWLADIAEQPAAILLKAAEQGDRIVLSVADSGPGIAPSDRGRVLERFVRLEQSRSEPGSGLGLSLAAAIARLHGGDLILEDNHPGLVGAIALPRVAVPVPAPVA